MERREEEAGLVADTNILISALIKDYSINARLVNYHGLKAVACS
jgi:hypothetical protein